MQFRSLQNHPHSDSINLIGDYKPQLREARNSSVLMAVTINRFLSYAVLTSIFLTLAGQGHAQDEGEKRVNTGFVIMENNFSVTIPFTGSGVKDNGWIFSKFDLGEFQHRHRDRQDFWLKKRAKDGRLMMLITLTTRNPMGAVSTEDFMQKHNTGVAYTPYSTTVKNSSCVKVGPLASSGSGAHLASLLCWHPMTNKILDLSFSAQALALGLPPPRYFVDAVTELFSSFEMN
jgi:hypothetical protein